MSVPDAIALLSYRVEFSDERLYLNRKSVMALCDHSNQRLLIWRGADACQLRQALHEAMDMILPMMRLPRQERVRRPVATEREGLTHAH